MNCPSCSTPNRNEARFCIKCGTRLAAAPDLAEETPITPDASVPTPGTETERHKTSLETDSPPQSSELDLAQPVAPSSTEDVSSDEMTHPSSPAEKSTLPDDQAPTQPLSDRETIELAPPQSPAGYVSAEHETPDIESGQPEAIETAPSAPKLPKTTTDKTSPEFPHGQAPDQDMPAEITAATPAIPESSVEPASPVEQPPPAQLPIGTMLQNRFEILGVLSSQADETLYEARDHLKCWQCGELNLLSDDRFCAACGAELLPERQLCHLLEMFSALTDVPAEALAHFEENNRWYIARPTPVARTPPESTEAAPSGLRLAAGLASHPGQIREQDEDSVLALTLNAVFEGHFAPCLGFYAVADGIGGHESGEIASQMALRVTARSIVTHVILPEIQGDRCLEPTAVERLTEAVQQANGGIFLHRHQATNEMGTTLTAALVLRDKAIVVNVGDSRTYLWRAGALKQITTDHSAVARLVEAGQIEPDEIYTHPQKSSIYRSLGDKPALEQVDSFIERLAPGDRLLLCCDGVWESLRPDGLEEVLLTWPDPQHAADEIIKRANLAGGEDNLSVVIVSIEGG